MQQKQITVREFKNYLKDEDKIPENELPYTKEKVDKNLQDIDEACLSAAIDYLYTTKRDNTFDNIVKMFENDDNTTTMTEFYTNHFHNTFSDELLQILPNHVIDEHIRMTLEVMSKENYI